MSDATDTKIRVTSLNYTIPQDLHMCSISRGKEKKRRERETGFDSTPLQDRLTGGHKKPLVWLLGPFGPSRGLSNRGRLPPRGREVK